MGDQTFRVPFGRGSVSFSLPEGITGTILLPGNVATVTDPREAVEAALVAPIGTGQLRDMATGKRRVVIAVTDATRACPDHLLVPPMLRVLADAGVPDNAITIMVAIGTHRPSTDAEKREKLGDAIVDRYRVIDHDPWTAENLVAISDGLDGVPFQVNKLTVEADLLIATGRVEPHQYAGYSGGGKTIAIGCAGEAIITYTHGPAMLDRAGVRLAQLAGNPFQEAVRRVAKAVGLDFVANVVMDDHERIVAIGYGAPEAVQDRLAGIASTFVTVQVERQFDIAVAGVGYPKDQNLYQASRAASYLHFAPVPAVRTGGVIIIPAPCPEGPGDGVGERQFAETMGSETPDGIIARIRRDGIRPGEQRAYIMAQVLKDVQVIIAGPEDAATIERCGFMTAPTVEDALAQAAVIVGDGAHVAVVPHALMTLPVMH